jgi:hypothetical protein
LALTTPKKKYMENKTTATKKKRGARFYSRKRKKTEVEVKALHFPLFLIHRQTHTHMEERSIKTNRPLQAQGAVKRSV